MAENGAGECRNGKVVRLLYLMLDLAQPGGRALQELAEAYEVNERTIRRDLDALQDASLPVVKEGGRWRLDVPGPLHPNLQMTPPEAFLLLLCLSMAKRGLLPRDREGVERVRKKAAVLLPKKVLALADRLANLYVPVNQPAPTVKHDATTLRDLENAITTVCWVRFGYSKRSGEKSVYTVAPHALLTAYGRVYLLGHVREHVDRAPITFAVARIENAELIEDPDDIGVTFPDPVDVEAYVGQSFGLWHEEPLEVEIIFRGDAVQTISATRFHPTQRTEALPDGSLRLTMQAGGYHEILWWVLGFGDEAEVVKPEEMREEIVGTLLDALDNYQSG